MEKKFALFWDFIPFTFYNDIIDFDTWVNSTGNVMITSPSPFSPFLKDIQLKYTTKPS